MFAMGWTIDNYCMDCMDMKGFVRRIASLGH